LLISINLLNLLISSIMAFVSFVGFTAFKIAPEMATPSAPVFRIAATSSFVIPPIATIGIFLVEIFFLISLKICVYPSIPRI